MISIDISVAVVINLPISYSFSVLGTGVTIITPTGTISSNGNIETAIQFVDEDSLDNAVVTLEATDGVCINTIPITLTSPCDALSIGTINSIDYLEFNILASGSTNYLYTWSYDTNVLKVNTSSDNSIKFDLISDFTGLTSISVKVIDVVTRCEKTAVIFYNICKIELPDLTVNLDCYPDGISRKVIQLNDLSTGLFNVCNSQPDWDTLTFSDNSAITHLGNGLLSFENPSTGVAFTGSLTYTVNDLLGVKSTTGTISLSVPVCQVTTQDFIISPTTSLQVTSNNVVGDILTIDLGAKVTSSSPIDWSTFTLVNSVVYGTAVLNANNIIEYTITSLATSNVEVIKWSLENTTGQSVIVNDIINRDVQIAPITSAVTTCVACDTSSPFLDLTPFITNDFDKSTIQLSSTNNQIQWFNDGNDNYSFNVPIGITGTQIVSYTVKNSQGVISNSSDITLSVICPGVPTSNPVIISCVSQVFNLSDYMTGVQNVDGSGWAEIGTNYTGQGGVITNVQLGSVDFTTITAGTYTFRFTVNDSVNCPGVLTSDLVITKTNAGSLTYGFDVDNLDGTFTSHITVDAIATSQVSVQVGGINAIYTSPLTITGNTLNFTACFDSAGANTVTITYLNNCNVTTNIVQIINNTTNTIK